MNSQNTLTTGDPEEFIGELEEMDLSEIIDEESLFMVAQQTGDPRGPRYVPSTIRGPYNFYEMAEEVGRMWKDEQVHAKVIYCERDRELPMRWLDECTIDFIEARWEDIVTEGFLGGAFDEDIEYTCKAGIVSEKDYEELMKEQAEEDNAEQDTSP